MTEPQARSIDPRDERWELWNPDYRVYFWRRSGSGWVSRECELVGEDVAAVLRWAEEHSAADETYLLYAVVKSAEGLGLVRLLGEDPTRSASA